MKTELINEIITAIDLKNIIDECKNLSYTHDNSYTTTYGNVLPDITRPILIQSIVYQCCDDVIYTLALKLLSMAYKHGCTPDIRTTEKSTAIIFNFDKYKIEIFEYPLVTKFNTSIMSVHVNMFMIDENSSDKITFKAKTCIENITLIPNVDRTVQLSNMESKQIYTSLSLKNILKLVPENCKCWLYLSGYKEA